MEKPVRRIAFLALLGALPAWSQTAPAVVDPATQQVITDSIGQNLDQIEGMVRKGLLSGSSKPVSFAGEALFRFIGTTYDEYPSWMQTDRTENKNSVASVRVAMVAAPHRNLRLWSKIAFNAAMYGTNKPANGINQNEENAFYKPTPQTGYFDPHSNNVYEDMCAGLTAAIGKATTSLKLGGVLWTEASPLTVWKGQNRLFGWDYVPYELEQSSAQYYEYATSKGERTGRAAWNKKAFQGFQWESQDLPGKMYFELTYGNFEGFQKWQAYEPNPNNTNGLMYTAGNAGGINFYMKGTGIGNTFRQATVLRIARQELPLPDNQALPIQLGFNYVNYHADNDFAQQFVWSQRYGGLENANDADQVRAWGVRGTDTTFLSNYFISSKAFSVDARQTVAGKINFMLDVGMSQSDTSFFRVDSGSTTYKVKSAWYRNMADSATIAGIPQYGVIAHRESNWTPAVYLSMSNLLSGTVGGPMDLGFQTIYAPKKFYSGTSFVMPVDFFFPYEANLIGAGKFAGTDGGTPYTSNETGLNLTWKYVRVPNGHLRGNIGYHTQLENGSDLLFIPWRLNGTAFKLSVNQSTTQYDGAGLTDDFIRGNDPYSSGPSAKTAGSVPGAFRQVRRMGNDFFTFNNPNGKPRRNPYGPTPGLAGGIRNDFLSTFEDFGMFKMRRGGEDFAADTTLIRAMILNGDMPQSTKSTQNLSIDYGQDISPLWSGKNPLFLGLYGAVNGVTAGGLPLPSNEKTYLSGYLLRFEPVFQVTQKLWMIGLVGQERWYSRFGVAAIDSTTGYAPGTDAAYNNSRNWHKAPVDYTDMSYGVGFDLGLSPRVELHTRLQYFTHQDDGISEEIAAAKGKNDYKAWYLHAETKMWF